MSRAQRRVVLAAAVDAAARGEHATARALFASVGVSYHVTTTN